MRRARTVLLLAATSLALLVAPAGAASPASRVVVGSDGWLFIAQDWTVACQDRGRARRTATAARDLAAALEAGGRRAGVTLGPDKSTPLVRHVPRTGVRDRACGDASRAALWRELTTTGGPAFLDLRRPLAQATSVAQTYWRKDTHWTSTAGAVYARELARRLDPQVAAGLQATTLTSRRAGDLARVLGRPDAETVRGLQVRNPGVRVEELAMQDVGLDLPARRTRTVREPGARVVPGRTVFVGDSFDDTVVEQLAPLFEEAVFFWPGERASALPTVVRQLRAADTVVVESVERFAQRAVVLQPAAAVEARRLPPR